MKVAVKRSVLREIRLCDSHILIEGFKKFLSVRLLSSIFNDMHKIQCRKSTYNSIKKL